MWKSYNVGCIGFRHKAIFVKHDCIINVGIVAFNLYHYRKKHLTMMSLKTDDQVFLDAGQNTEPLQVCYWGGCCDESWNLNSESQEKIK